MVTGNNQTNLSGLIGSVSSAKVINSFYDEITSGKNDTGRGIPKSTADMKKQTTFTGWDFGDVWEIGESVSYPTLQWQQWTPDGRITAAVAALVGGI
jgi:hypothetical protein